MLDRATRLLVSAAVLAAPALGQRLAHVEDGRVVLATTDGEVEWTFEGGHATDVHVLPNGNVVLADSIRDVVEVSPVYDEIVWSLLDARVRSEGGDVQAVEVVGLQPLDGQRFLVATSYPSRVAIYDRRGRVEREWPLPKLGCVDVALYGEDVVLVCTEEEVVALDGEGRRVPSPVPEDHGLARLEAVDVVGDHVLLMGRDAEGGAAKAIAPAFDVAPDVPPGASVWRVVDWGPDAGIHARARAIHRSVTTLDTHKDISSRLASEDAPEDPTERARFRADHDPRVWGSNQADFPKLKAGGLDVTFFIVYVGQGQLDEEGFARAKSRAMAKFDAIHRMCRRFPDEIELARSPADVERIRSEGKLVACIGIENGYAMGEDLSLVEEFRRLGAGYMSLTHNRHSQLGDSNTPADEPMYGGLSDLGRSAIEEMNRQGIMVDVSHAAKSTMMQAVAHSKAPTIASHSSTRALCDHTRNLDDEQLRAMRDSGGVVQCVAFASYVKDESAFRAEVAKVREELGYEPGRRFTRTDDSAEARARSAALRERVAALRERFPRADVADFVDHVDHAVSVAGIDHVAISSDFDGGGGVVGWDDASETFAVTLELVRRGYTEAEIAKLWSGNTLRLWAEVRAVAERLSEEGR